MSTLIIYAHRESLSESGREKLPQVSEKGVRHKTGSMNSNESADLLSNNTGLDLSCKPDISVDSATLQESAGREPLQRWKMDTRGYLWC